MLMWILYKISIIPTLRQNHFLLKKILNVEIPKYTVLVILFRVFMCQISLINEVPRSIIHLQYFEMVSKKIRGHLLQAIQKIEFLRHPLIMQWYPRKNKKRRATLKFQMKNIIYLLKQRMMHCLRLGKKYLPLYWIR